MKEQGFTLIELLLSLLLSGVLAHLATPSFKGLLESHQQRSAASSLADGLRFARIEAVARNRAVIIHALEDDWSRGWRVIEDVSGRGHQDDDNPVLLERQASLRTTIVGNGPVKSQVRFSGLGEPVFTGEASVPAPCTYVTQSRRKACIRWCWPPAGASACAAIKPNRRYAEASLGFRAASEPAAPWA